MLKLAFPYQDKLNKEWQSVAFDDRYKFFSSSWIDYKLKLSDNSWDRIQMVSVNSNDNILGYLSAELDRATNRVSALCAINFCGLNIVFSKDFAKFLNDLFIKYNFRKIEWFVIVGNPAEKMYDKIIEKYGGRIIGIRKESAVTMDGVYRDEKEYEIFKSEYLCRKLKGVV